MNRVARILGPLAALTLLSACADDLHASVARFHASQPIGRGMLHVQPAAASMGQSLEFRIHAETVAAQLRRNGFQTVPDAGQAQYPATVDISQTDGTTMNRPGSAASIPPGGAVLATPVGGGASSTEATLSWAVPALAAALFADFPGTPGVTQQIRL